MVVLVRKLAAFFRSHLLALAYLIVISFLSLYAYRLESLARDTNQILKVEVQEKDAQIGTLNYLLGEQAVPAVTYLLRQCRQQGSDCPQVLISPAEPPFADQLAEQKSP